MPITPSWTDSVSVIASQSVAAGASVSGTLGLATKVAAYIFIRIGRTGTTVLGAGIVTLIRRTLNVNAVAHPGNVFAARGPVAVAASTTVGTDSAAGQKVLKVVNAAGFAADDFILIGGGGVRQEWARISKVPVGNDIFLDRNLTYTHTAAQADTVRNKAECYDPVWVLGGTTIEVVVDHTSTGDNIIVEVLAQTYNQDTT